MLTKNSFLIVIKSMILIAYFIITLKFLNLNTLLKKAKLLIVCLMYYSVHLAACLRAYLFRQKTIFVYINKTCLPERHVENYLAFNLR